MSDKNNADQNLVEALMRLKSDEYEASADFNQYYDDQGGKVEIGGLLFPPSKVLFWLDKNVYDEARDNWNNEIKHKDAIQLLNDNGQKVSIKELSDAIKRGRIVPFVGAGLSRPMGLPLWGMALKEIYGDMPDFKDPAVLGMIETGRYLDAAEKLAAHDEVVVQNYIKRRYKVVSGLQGPVLLLPEISSGCVVTTNFDNVIEEIFDQHGRFDAYMHGTQNNNFFSRLAKGQRCLLKLHGDAENPKSYIFTKSQYVAAYGDSFDFQRPLPMALRQIFISNSMLFLGCSLEQDRTLELFEHVKNREEYEIPCHYAIIPAPADENDKKRKSQHLGRVNIEPIWYPDGQHEYVERILNLLIDIVCERMTI